MAIESAAVDALGKASVRTLGGDAVELGSLWGDGPVVLVFLRHFGCVGCSMNVTGLSPRLWELHEMGARTVFIGNGELPYMEAFVERFALSDKRVAVVTDTARVTYQIVGLPRSWWGTAGPRAVWDLIDGFGKGHLNGAIRGDLIQQGGTLILDAARTPVVFHQNRSLSDHLPAVEIVGAVQRLFAQSARAGGAA